MTGVFSRERCQPPPLRPSLGPASPAAQFTTLDIWGGDEAWQVWWPPTATLPGVRRAAGGPEEGGLPVLASGGTKLQLPGYKYRSENS